jgi:uncharacterized protein YhaN
MQFEKFYNNPVGDVDVLEADDEDLDLEAAHDAANKIDERRREEEESRLADLVAEQERIDKEDLDRLYNDKDVMGDIFPHSRKLRGLEDKD